MSEEPEEDDEGKPESGTCGTASSGEVARRLADGSLRLLENPARRFVFHRPTVIVPPLQWAPEVGFGRYEWERRHTPAAQRPYFEHLRRAYRIRPPRPIPADLAREAEVSRCDLANGLPGLQGEVARRLREHVILETDPCREWWFSVEAEVWRGVVCDRLAISHKDRRTLPDWDLLVRMRSWVLDDDREAFVWLPESGEGCLSRYENARPNSLQVISPRAVQPGETRIARAVRSPSDADREAEDAVARARDALRRHGEADLARALGRLLEGEES